MRMKQGRAILGILLAAALLSGCDGANNSSVMETQPPTETRPAATEPNIAEPKAPPWSEPAILMGILMISA